MKIIVDIAGRFTIADQTPEYLAVGFIGSAWADRLPPAQLNHVRGFYGMTGKRTEVWPSYPVKLNRNYLPVLTRPPENGGNDMSKIYMAVTVCQDKNETTLPREHTRNAAPVITLMFCHARPGKTSNLRLIASADCRSPTFAAPKKRRRSL